MKPWNERRPSGPLPGSPQDGWVHRNGMAPMAQWPQLEEAIPLVAGPMRRYLAQIDTVLRPGSVKNTDQALRSFGTFLIEHHREVTRLGEVTRSHIEDYKPWLAARPGRQARASTATLAHRLGTLRMFVRIDEWGWQEAPIKVPMFPGDLPRQDQQRSQPPGRTPLRPAMTSPQSPGGSATPAQDAALGLVIYADRMGTYLAAAHGDPARARRMYVWDRDLSSALLADIAIVEVALRNAMHKALAATWGPRWYEASALSSMIAPSPSSGAHGMNSRPAPRQIVQTAYARFYATEAERRNSRRRTAIMGRERKP